MIPPYVAQLETLLGATPGTLTLGAIPWVIRPLKLDAIPALATQWDAIRVKVETAQGRGETVDWPAVFAERATLMAPAVAAATGRTEEEFLDRNTAHQTEIVSALLRTNTEFFAGALAPAVINAGASMQDVLDALKNSPVVKPPAGLAGAK